MGLEQWPVTEGCTQPIAQQDGSREINSLTSLSSCPPISILVPPISQARGKGRLLIQFMQTSLLGPRTRQRKELLWGELLWGVSRKYTVHLL